MDENQELAEILSKEETRNNSGKIGASLTSPPSNNSPAYQQNLDHCQWQVGPNGVFRAAAKTIPALESGAYSTGEDQYGQFLKSKTLLSDEIVELPESPNARMLSGIQKFWTEKRRYASRGLVFKRGILMWGAPGSGKTVGIHLLAQDLIKNGGIVVFCDNPHILGRLMIPIREIEPTRPLIVVMEDIDETIANYGEHEILAMLDGENQTDNVVYIATTNYPEKLGARILNRPSRFDERIKVGMPSAQARARYFYKMAVDDDGKSLDEETIARWTQETEGLSIAHLRELIAAVLCLDQNYSDVLARLKSMQVAPKETTGYGADGSLGFR